MTTMNYIGLDVHKKTISYCVKDVSCRIQQEGKVGATRRELDCWMKSLPQPWTVAMEATIFSGWIYDHPCLNLTDDLHGRRQRPQQRTGDAQQPLAQRSAKASFIHHRGVELHLCICHARSMTKFVLLLKKGPGLSPITAVCAFIGDSKGHVVRERSFKNIRELGEVVDPEGMVFDRQQALRAVHSGINSFIEISEQEGRKLGVLDGVTA
jgi:hypothetical protein